MLGCWAEHRFMRFTTRDTNFECLWDVSSLTFES